MRDQLPGPLPAYEIKFVIGEDRARKAEAWARGALRPDPHGHGGTYTTMTLYCDTPEFAIYHGTPAFFRQRKFRVRRYGADPCVFLERKTKRENRVAKRRVEIPIDELRLLAAGAAAPEGWAGSAFLRQIRQHRLAPSGLVSYARTAYEGLLPEGPLRLTIDRDVTGLPCRGWTLHAPAGAGRRLLDGTVILELKFRGGMPAPFKRLMHELRLEPRPISKYRLCWQVWGAPTAHA